MGYGVIKVVDNKAEMVTMGVIDLRKFGDGYLKLGHIFERVTGIIEGYLPDEMAIEAPFLQKNVQTTLKLGRSARPRVCAHEDQDGHYGQRCRLKRTGRRDVATAAEVRQGGVVEVYGCDRRLRCCLLSLHADEPPGIAGSL